ncbi:MAG TPA: murein biosynthesis integral membrane protein MurJ [Chlamydiales bacterium]|nr:murein biosynthesis integral membrane protein MurJ [Chlamydiales bacterium]
MDTPKTISSSVRHFFCGSMLSRITGVGRDIALAFFLGSTPLLASFFVAFRFSYLLRRLLGESVVSAGFVPYFEQLDIQSPKKAAAFFKDLNLFLSAFLFFLIIVGEFLLFWVRGHTQFYSQELFYVHWMLPGLLFICLYALNSSLLQCQRKFFLFSFAPTLFNLVWIGTIFYIRNMPLEQGLVILSIGVTFAYFMQWLLTAVPSFFYLKMHYSLFTFFKDKIDLKVVAQIVKPLSFMLLGVGAMQINSLLDALFAKSASSEGPAYLWYAIRVQQLPIALFAVASMNALLPPLARAYEGKEYSQFENLFQDSLKKSSMMMLIATFGIFSLGFLSIDLLFGRGAFDQNSAIMTTKCLWGYGLALIPTAFVMILNSAYYAKKNYVYPTIVSMVSVFFNIILNAFFIFQLKWGVVSIAVSTSIAAMIQALLLKKGLVKHVMGISLANVYVFLLQPFISSLVGGVLAFWASKNLLILTSQFQLGMLTQLFNWSVATGCYFFGIAVSMYLFRFKEMRQLATEMIRK